MFWLNRLLVAVVAAGGQLVATDAHPVCFTMVSRFGEPRPFGIVGVLADKSTTDYARAFDRGCAAALPNGTYRVTLRDLRLKGEAGLVTGSVTVRANTTHFAFLESEGAETADGVPVSATFGFDGVPLRVTLTRNQETYAFVSVASAFGWARYQRQPDSNGMAHFTVPPGTYVITAVRDGKVVAMDSVAIRYADRKTGIALLEQTGRLVLIEPASR